MVDFKVAGRSVKEGGAMTSMFLLGIHNKRGA